MLFRRLALTCVLSLSACGPTLYEGPRDVTDDTPPLPGVPDPMDTADDTADDDEVDPFDVDTDGDGLSDGEEQALGTNPAAVDTDGDGHGDLDEVFANTDPLDGSDRPYQGGWSIGMCRDSIVSNGNNPGQVAHDFGLTDQFGDTVHLHDFCDRAVLLITSADWCGACQYEAPEIQAMYDQYRAQGFIPITLLGEGDPATWANAFGLDHPVLSDPGYTISSRFVGYGGFSLPSMHLLGEGAQVVSVEGWVGESQVVNALP